MVDTDTIISIKIARKDIKYAPYVRYMVVYDLISDTMPIIKKESIYLESVLLLMCSMIT